MVAGRGRWRDPGAFWDTYQEGLLEIINAKLHDWKPKLIAAKEEPGKVINIMDALKRSLGDSGGKKAEDEKSGIKP